MSSELIPVPQNLDLDVTIRGLSATQRVFGRYDLRRILGRGGMGIVWLAHDDRLERNVALKFLPDDVFFDPAALDELKRETRRCLDLTHPNIIRIYDFMKDEQAAAISMEYIDGKTLAELRIERPKRVFEVDEIRKWIDPVCQALQYAHAEVGVVHRDLKPANLMITARQTVKIADFGISQSMSDSMSRRTIRHGTSSGTLAYMSPQQLNGEVTRPTDDIYAFGATLYELLTGKPPFHSGDVPFQIRLTVPKSVAERRAELGIEGEPIPPEWEDTLAACLSKIPAERPTDMADVAARLGEAISRRKGGEIEVPKPSPVSVLVQPPPLPKAARAKIPVGQTIAGAVALILMIALIGRFLFPGSARGKAGDSSAEPGGLATGAGRIAAPLSDGAPDPAPSVAELAGTLAVDAKPAGAHVLVQGLPSQIAPANFRLRPGVYVVVVSAPGYESQQVTITVASNAKAVVSTLELQRSTGALSLVTVPANVPYVMTGTGAAAGVIKKGITPVTTEGIPTGAYQVAFSSPAFSTVTTPVVISAGRPGKLQIDLIDRAVTAQASPLVVTAFHGGPVATLSVAERTELAAISAKAFSIYANFGMLNQASAQIKVLQGLSMDTTAEQSILSTKSLRLEKAATAEIGQLVAHGHLATAEMKLRQLGQTLDAATMERIRASEAGALSAYEQQIDSAIRNSATQTPEAARQSLAPLRQKYPDDLNLLLAEARAQTRTVPVDESLASELGALQKFGAQDKAGDPDLAAMIQVFTREHEQLDALTKGLKAAKVGPAALQDEIENLRAEQMAFRRRRVGAPKNPFSSAINFFGKAVTGHTVVDNAAYFASSDDKRAAIAGATARIEQDKACLAQPAVPVAEAQARYDQFIAQVPWVAATALVPDSTASAAR